MNLNLNSMMVGTMQAQVMGEFYDKVFAMEPTMVDEGGRGWQVGSCFFWHQ